MNRNESFNYHLAISKQIYGEIIKVIPLSELKERRNITDKEQTILKDLSLQLYIHLREVKEYLSGSVMKEGVPVQKVTEGLAEFYFEVLVDNFDLLMNLYQQVNPVVLDMGELGMVTIDVPGKRPEYEGPTEDNDIRKFMLAAVDRCHCILDESEGAVFTEDAYDGTLKFMANEFFRPDAWLDNLSLLKPVITVKEVSSIPAHVRIRLGEIYRSFVFENWLSVMSLSRSLLEYMILDRHSNIGIDAYSKEGGKNSPKRLGILVSLVSEVLPEILDKMQYVVSSGHDVMHPRKKSNVSVIVARNVREQAFNCVSYIRSLAEYLYRKKL